MTDKKTKAEKEADKAIIAMQAEAVAQAELDAQRKAVKAHIEQTLGDISDYAKGLVNDADSDEMSLWVTWDYAKLSKRFGQGAVDKAACNVFGAASPKTALALKKRRIDKKKESREIVKKAESEFLNTVEEFKTIGGDAASTVLIALNNAVAVDPDYRERIGFQIKGTPLAENTDLGKRLVMAVYLEDIVTG